MAKHKSRKRKPTPGLQQSRLSEKASEAWHLWREGIRLSIFEKYSRKYHVLDDEAIKVMYKQASAILAW